TKDEKGRKVPYPVKSGSITFLNKNPGTKSAAVIVWVITGDAPNVDAAEVYDADAAPLAPTPGALITILDAEPFVISTATDGRKLIRRDAPGKHAAYPFERVLSLVFLANDSLCLHCWI
ncbi:hypothetical protein PMAYCL1PPCAC_22074, partial [Pristionchus mayeri]